MTIDQSKTTNKLLHGLTSENFALIGSHLQHRQFALDYYVVRSHEPITSVVFPESCIASRVIQSPEGKDVEVALIGFEGMTGTALIMGDDRTPLDSYIQSAGAGYVLPAWALVAALDKSRSLERYLLRYVQTLIIQASSTALINGMANAETRLARWLLMLHDRTTGANISTTHEFIAVMLAMRRPWVTETLHLLEGKHLIKTSRGSIRILNRAGLIAEAKGFYGLAETEYARIMTPPDPVPKVPLAYLAGQ
jgi:CRP-like cAMP-binding protein